MEVALKPHKIKSLNASSPFLAGIILEKRHYNPEEHPAYLVFEYYSDKILRAVQSLGTISFESKKLADQVHNFYKSLSPTDQKMAINYLTQNKNKKAREAAQNFYNKQFELIFG